MQNCQLNGLSNQPLTMAPQSAQPSVPQGVPQNVPQSVPQNAPQNVELKQDVPKESIFEDKNKKKAVIGAAAVAITALAIGGIMFAKNKNAKKAMAAFDNVVNNAAKGHNKILSESIQKEDEAVQAFIKEHPEDWDKLKKNILNLVDVKNADEVLQDGVIYHGTSTKSAKNILKEGATPFSQKRAGSGSGMGYGIYTTPDLKTAEFYSDGGMILPFEMKGKVAVLKDGIEDADKIKMSAMTDAMQALDGEKKVADSIIYFPEQETASFVSDNQSYLVTKAMQELGIDAIYTKGATTNSGLFGNIFNKTPEFIDNAGQLTVFNGEKLHLKKDAIKDINSYINYKMFM